MEYNKICSLEDLTWVVSTDENTSNVSFGNWEEVRGLVERGQKEKMYHIQGTR